MELDGPDNRDSRLSPNSSNILDLSNLVPSVLPKDSEPHSRNPFQRLSSPHVPDIDYSTAAPKSRSSNAKTGPKGFVEVDLGITTPLVGESSDQLDPLLPGDESVGTPTGSSMSKEGTQQREDTGLEPKANMPPPRESLRSFDNSQTVRLYKTSPPSSFGWSPPQENQHNFKCPTRGRIVHKALSWFHVAVLILAIYSTLLSGIYLAVALLKPRFGKSIGTDGGLAPSTANLLSALFAKTIELSFVTVFVSFLGQVLSRRAVTRDSRGITIADMTMRMWIMQPGTLITHWETVRYSGWTILGVISLMASFSAMLYTTAAEALVSPKLVMGPLELRTLYGQVYTKFANPDYLSENCQTPITTTMDPLYRGTTCLEIEHVGQAFHNYEQYIAEWSKNVTSGISTSTTLALRPKPQGTLYDNTTVTGSWIETQNMTELTMKYGRMVNNVTAAMPHAGIFAAARDPSNGIRQPDDLGGQGEYEIEASVPSPALNVLCVGMSEEELAPLIYTKWPDTAGEFDGTTWNFEPPGDIPIYPDWLNRTVVDELFGFGQKYGQRPPIFPKLPKPYNTLLNTTGLFTADAIYILGAAPENFSPEYVLCSLKAKQTDLCSTRYKVASSGGRLGSECEIPGNSMQYSRRVEDVLDEGWETDWKNVASEWATSISLGSGIMDGAASNARLLTQLIPKFDRETNTSSLDPELPSIGEALAVMAGSTLLLSTQNAPFVPFWNYSTTYINESVYQSFNATLRAVGYAAGGTERWQGVFYIVLLFTFVTNVICLAFMVFEVRGKQMTDFTEPQNLFALAINSPPALRLQGACGAGPTGRQLDDRWYVGMDEADQHYYIRAKAEEKIPYQSPTMSQIGNKDDKGRGHFEPFEMGGDIKPAAASPAVKDFRKLSRRDTLLARLYY